MSESPLRPSRGPALTPARLLIILLVFYLIIQIKLIVLLFLLAILFATVIERPLIRLEHRGIPRAAGILTIYAAILVALGVLFVVFVPLVNQESREMARELPVMIDELAADWRTSDNPILSGSGYRLLTRLRFRFENPPPPPEGAAIDIVGRIGAVVLGFVSLFVIGFYWLMEKHFLRRLVVEHLDDGTGERVSRLWDSVEAKVGDWLRGQLILCLIIGVAAAIGYGSLGVRFWLLLALLAGVTELIPVLGPWIGGIPAVGMALLDSWQKALLVTAFLVLLQLAENTILVPRIMKGAIGLSPLTVFVAILAGGKFMGPLGALLSIPFAAALQVIISDTFTERKRQQAQDVADGREMNWRQILSHLLSQEAHGIPPQQGLAEEEAPDAAEEESSSAGRQPRRQSQASERKE